MEALLSTDTEIPVCLSPQKVKEKVKRPRRAVTCTYHTADVTDDEIQMMKLTAQTCREINARAKDQSETIDTKKPPSCNRKASKAILNTYANDAFFVKTTNRPDYVGSLAIARHLVHMPTTMCPDVDKHVEGVYTLRHTLPLACPTCWSLQRNYV
ncbi:hypothetical protein KP79_PYT17621 [Mizuhopecten yessoensis]|uniref:Uncharacterized protein n=1 Tax=Mizuhopecten yessoensis TaxID=6573 RepID=A0A210QF42_MIZYE|nr:hypothetical protein KP79_PYT17621 [Mizuhopecten yessoensis]